MGPRLAVDSRPSGTAVCQCHRRHPGRYLSLPSGCLLTPADLRVAGLVDNAQARTGTVAAQDSFGFAHTGLLPPQRGIHPALGQSARQRGEPGSLDHHYPGVLHRDRFATERMEDVGFRAADVAGSRSPHPRGAGGAGGLAGNLVRGHRRGLAAPHPWRVSKKAGHGARQCAGLVHSAPAPPRTGAVAQRSFSQSQDEPRSAGHLFRTGPGLNPVAEWSHWYGCRFGHVHRDDRRGANQTCSRVTAPIPPETCDHLHLPGRRAAWCSSPPRRNKHHVCQAVYRLRQIRALACCCRDHRQSSVVGRWTRYVRLSAPPGPGFQPLRSGHVLQQRPQRPHQRRRRERPGQLFRGSLADRGCDSDRMAVLERYDRDTIRTGHHLSLRGRYRGPFGLHAVRRALGLSADHALCRALLGHDCETLLLTAPHGRPLCPGDDGGRTRPGRDSIDLGGRCPFLPAARD